ncbi:MAG: hypothetical protein J6I55_00050 [Ruminococcus sp.]|nr:hypothetical protein [Ruminococcus sp.]
MKNITRKIIAVAALLCVAATSIVSCGSSRNNNDSDSKGDTAQQQVTEAPVLQFPFEIGTVALDDTDMSLDAADPTQASEDEQSAETAPPVTEIQKVTDAQGQPVTQVVAVTDAAGQPATNAQGQQETQVVEVTSVYVADGNTNSRNNNSNTTANNNSNNNNNNNNSNGNSGSSSETPAASEAAYTASIDGRYAMWLDISKDKNFMFEGPFIKLTFKVKDDAPDGDYKVRLSPDLSDIAGKTINPGKVADGIIRVSKGDIDPADDTGTMDNYYYCDNIACKQGDTIDYYLNVKNNTGLAAFCVWFYYDKNALDLVGAEPTGEFKEIAAQSPEFGGAATKAEE